MSTTRYWIIGGEFRSLDFDKLMDGTGQILGPFQTQDDAERAWRQTSEQYRASCCTRFIIVPESVRATS